MHEGRTLAAWLPELVAEEPETRRRAGAAVAMIHLQCAALPGAPFQAGMTAALESGRFPSEPFVRALIARCRKESDDRLTKFTNGECDFTMADVGGMTALGCVGTAARPVVPQVVEMLSDRDSGIQEAAFKILGALGVAARHCLRDILPKLGGYWSSEASQALSEIVGDDAVSQDLIIRLLEPGNPVERRRCAISILAALGTRVRRVSRTLLTMTENTEKDLELRAGAVGALGQVSADVDAETLDRVLERLLEIERREDPYLRTSAHYSLGALRRRPAEAVPLIAKDLGNTDACDKEPHAGAVWALGKFGPEAAPAVPTLLNHLKVNPQVDSAVVETLGLIGPAAAAALPKLERLSKKAYIDPRVVETAMHRIRGQD